MLNINLCRSLLIFILLFVLAACGGGGGGGSSVQTETELQGQFVDSAVLGLRFESLPSGKTGTTNANGAYIYVAGDTIYFYVGDILIGSATGAPTITPVSLVPGATDETNQVVMNIAQFLQSLDQNRTPGDGITIIQDAFNAALGLSLDFSLTDFITVAEGIVQTIRSIAYPDALGLIDRNLAQTHLAISLNVLNPDPCTGSLTMAGTDFNATFLPPSTSSICEKRTSTSGDGEHRISWFGESEILGNLGNMKVNYGLDGSINSVILVWTISTGPSTFSNYAYSSSCPSGCSEISIDEAARTVTFTGLVVPVFSALPYDATAPVTLTGTLSFNIDPDSVGAIFDTGGGTGGDTTVNTSAYAGTYTGTYTGEDSGTWTFVIDAVGNLTATIISDTTGEFTGSSFVSSAGVISGNGMTGTVSTDGTISGTWPGSAGGTGNTYSGTLDTGGNSGGNTGGVTDLGSVTLSGTDVSAANFGDSVIPVTAEAVDFTFDALGTTETIVYWRDIDLSAPPYPDYNSLVQIQFDYVTNEIIMVHLGSGHADGRSWVYRIDCRDTTACDGLGVTVDSVASQVTFVNAAIPVDTVYTDPVDNDATAPITLNGILSFTAP